MVGRRLNEVEVQSYDVCPEQIARRARIIRIPVIPGGYAGMTLGRTVLLAREVEADGRSALLAHELVHARQWADQGVVGFARHYLSGFVKNLYAHRRWNLAYQNIEAELEAKRETTAWQRRQSRARYEKAMEAEVDREAEAD